MRFLYFILFAIPIICQSQIKVDRDRLYKLLRRGKTRDVLFEARRLRENVYGKCAIIDYFIAKSLCMDKYYDESNQGFRYILQHYPLQQESRNFIEQEINNCSKKVIRAKQISQVDLLHIPLPKGGVSGTVGKMGRVNCSRIPNVLNYSDLASEEELESRLSELGDSVRAVEKVKSLVGQECNVVLFNPFILVSLKSQHVPDTITIKLAEDIKNTYDFYLSRYKLRQPGKYITVYLMPDQSSLRRLAKKIHGIALSNDPADVVLGYSIISDLSIIAMVTRRPDNNTSSFGITANFGGDIGNVYHELWHLLIRTDAGDISPWLDEGMASLYSTAKWSKGILYGAETWRTADLKSRKMGLFDSTIYTPRLVDLLSLNWLDFHGGIQRNLCQASINYSLANHFLLYIQSRGLLRNVVAAIKERRAPTKNADSTSDTDVVLIEKALNESIQEIQRKFEDWFANKHGFRLY